MDTKQIQNKNMRSSFDQLADARRVWIHNGHKNVPNPLCCCGYESPWRRDMTFANGANYRCPIHVGVYYALLQYTIAFLFVISSYLFLFQKTFERVPRMLARKYNDANIQNQGNVSGNNSRSNTDSQI